MGPLIISGSFFKSKTAATGIPKFDTGPQKWVVHMYLNSCFEKTKSVNFLKLIGYQSRRSWWLRARVSDAKSESSRYFSEIFHIARELLMN